MATHTNVYVSLALDHLPLMPRQHAACSRFKLTSRAELHVTLGYIGEAEEEQIASLARELAVLAHEPLLALALTGTGGAFEDAPGQVRPIGPNTTLADLEGRSRVLWWAMEPSEPLLRAQRAVREAILRVGLSDQFLPAEYSPRRQTRRARPARLGRSRGAEARDPRPRWRPGRRYRSAVPHHANRPAPAESAHHRRIRLPTRPGRVDDRLAGVR